MENVKKQVYSTPRVTIVTLAAEDVITTSTAFDIDDPLAGF